MKKIISTIKNLNQLSTYITDTSLLSPNIFNITYFPNELTLGKNLIKLKGVPNIFEDNSELNIEILDSNGYPIYNEIANYIDGDKSRVISIYIYDTTPIGKCTVTLTATLKSYNGQSIPSSWQNITNAKWSRDIIVNNKLANTTEILFDQTNLPDVTITEQIGVRLDRNFVDNTQFPTFTTGLINFEKRNGKKIAKITGGEFHPDMIGGTLTVDIPENPTPAPTQTTSSNKVYSSKIEKVLNKDFIQLEDNFVFSFSQSLQQHEYTKFDNSAFSISYEASPSYVTTQHSESFALTEIKNLEPVTGDISRIKLYVNSSATIGTYDLINDILLEPTEIFVDATGSIFPDIGVGFFTSQSIIDQYWNSHTYIGKSEATAPTLTFSTSSLNNAVIVNPSVDYREDNEVLVFETTSSLPGVFIENSEYKLIFDAIGSKNSLSNNENPKLSIYLSGSAFNHIETDPLNSLFPVKLGKKIGEIELRAESKRLDDRQFIFSADNNGVGSLLFVIQSGKWEFSDIRTLTSAESGFTENYTRFRTNIPVDHKSNNEIQFKIEYYNSDGVKSDHETIIGNKIFEGGNRYIDGGFSMLTGSLTVANSLNSGVEIVGLENTGYIRSLGYEGFNQATGSGGGFLLFSGSALPNQSLTSYQGVGLELVADANNFFKYRTNPSILDIHTETFFLGNPSTQFISGSNGQLEISSSGYHIQPTGDITASRFLMQGGTITNDVTILGSVSANSILTPAIINGNPSNESNASSSISDQGLAIFRSASIAGFEINTEEIKSPGNTLRLKSAGQITASDGFLFGNKASSNFVQFANNTLTVRGDLSVDQIFTPATIGGSPSDITNASSSITSTGFAKFTSASIGGWDITTGSIEAGNLIMKPEGILQTKDFASGFKGWKISSQGNGTAEFENVRIRGTLRTTTFEKESVNAIGGQVWVANATTITGSGVAITDTTMSVKNASGFSVNEILLAKKVDSTGFQTEYLLVESASLDGDNSNEDEVFGRIYVQRAYGSGSGGSFVGDLASNSQSYDEGQVIVSTGKIGTGYIKINANPNDADTPFIDIVERTGSGLYDVKLKARLGDLGGLANSDSVFGNSNPGFGLQTDNVFLQGGIRANTGSIGGIHLEDNKLYIGVGNHANSNTGFYVDSSSKFSLGDKLTWDGSALTVQGQLRLNSGQTVDDAINEATASNTAKTLVLTADSQVFAFPSASSTSATPTSIIFSIAQQNLTASISASDITITTAGGSSVTGFDFDTGSVTANFSTPPLYSGVVSGSLTFAGALSAGGLNNDKTNLPVTIVASRDGLSDTTTIFKIEGGTSGSAGADGAAGADAITAFLTNEAHTFPAAADGTVADFSDGTTDMLVFLGIENVTSSFTFTGSNSLGVTSISSSSTITVTSMAHDSGSIDITANSASVSLTKKMTLSKSKTGETGSNAKTLSLTSDSQVFSFLSASSNDAIDNDIIFSINQQNLSGTIASGDITISTAGGNVTGFSLDTNSVTSGTGIVSGSITFTGALSAGGLNSTKTNLPATITVTKDGLTDTTKIFKLEGGSSGSDGADGAAGADGAPAVTAFLTNEAHTFPADVNGTISSFTEGSSSMVVFVGLENSTSSFSYSKTDSTGVTSTLSGTDGNVIAISAMAHDSGSVDITATSASVSVTKTMTLAKSKQGAQGATGATGATGPIGPNFDFLTGSISEVDTTGGLSKGLLLTSTVLGFHEDIAEGDGTNATINDFTSFLDNTGNFFIGKDTAAHFAFSSASATLLISGSNVDIQTPSFFLGKENVQFLSGSDAKIEISSSNFHLTPEGNVTMSGTITADAGNIGGFEIDDISISSTNDNLILSSSGQVTASTLLLTGGSVGGLPVSSDEISVGSVLKLKNSGQITGSNVLFSGGEIGGFDLTSTQINSTNNNLILKDSGQITGSTVLFDGGKIGGFDVTSNELKSGEETQTFTSQSTNTLQVSASFVGDVTQDSAKAISGIQSFVSNLNANEDFTHVFDPVTTGNDDIYLICFDSLTGTTQSAFTTPFGDSLGIAPVDGYGGLNTGNPPFTNVSLAQGYVGSTNLSEVSFTFLTASFINGTNVGSFSSGNAFPSSSVTTTTTTRTITKIKLDADNRSISINTSSFGDDGIQLELESTTNRPRFFAGSNTGSFFKYDGDQIAISASNFSLTNTGDVTANRIELAEYSKADYFVFKLLTITTATSASYFEEYTYGGKEYYKLVLDGSLGGSVAQSVRINVTPIYPIGMIQPPVKLNNQGHEVTVECAISTGVGYASTVAVSGSTVYTYGFHADSDDWFNQLFQTRVYPAGGSTTYGGGSVGDVGASSGRVIIQNIGQRFRFIRSAYDFRLLGVSSYDTTANGNFNSQGLINFHSGIRTSNGPIFIGSTSTTYGQNTKMTAGYAFEVNNIVDRAGTTTNDAYFHGNIKVDGGFRDSSGDLGSSGQILSSTGTGTNWIANSGGGGSGDIEGVTAGNGLTGGGTSGTVSLAVGAGTGIDVTSTTVAVDVSDFMTNGSNNRVVTATGTDAMNAEANMTFDGSTLSVTGDILASSKIGLDTTDYITFTNNTRMDVYINNSNEFRFESDGDFHADGDIIGFSSTVSDSRLKDNIITIGGALDKIKSLRGVSYTWNSGKRKNTNDIGLIAQEVEKILPEVITEKKMPLMQGVDPNIDYKTVNYEKIIPVLIEAIKEQQEQINKLKKQIESK